MSNSQRIWINYAMFALTLVVVLGAPSVATSLGASDTMVSAVVMGALLVWAIPMIITINTAKCWHCREQLYVGPGGGAYPIMFWRHCRNCGVKHASRPNDVRRNPIGHFR